MSSQFSILALSWFDPGIYDMLSFRLNKNSHQLQAINPAYNSSQKGEDKRWRRSGRETVRREKMQTARR